MENRTLVVTLAAVAVTASATSSLIGFHRADATQTGRCADQVCVQVDADQWVTASDFEDSCATSTPVTELRAYATALSGQHGWNRAQHEALVTLWTRESRWEWDATNPTSGAYGIAQSLPPTKMAKAGKDWKTNPCTQIRWGLAYIDRRYDSPANAWKFWQQNNWY